jgi:hypothetical protein
MEKWLHGGKRLATLEIAHVVDFYCNFDSHEKGTPNRGGT